MIESKFCVPCGGSGKQMGGGMIIIDCEHCLGKGKINLPADDIEYLNFRATESFKNAVSKIKDADENISENQAEEMIKEAIYKLPKDKNKKGK